MIRKTLNRGILTALGALLVALSLPLVAKAADPDMTDSGIRDAIENEMLFDPSVPSDAIDVSVTDGVVTMTGTAHSLLAKERAARIAQTVKGVRSVINRIDVQPPATRSDAAIRNDVQTALLTDPATESYEVDVDVTAGAVTLAGTVDSWREKQLVETVTKSVRGVRDVVNEIDIEYTTVRTDTEIQREVEKTLQWDVLVDHHLVDVSVEGGEVTLTGIVGSAAEKNHAIAKAWVGGVEDVDGSALEVAGWADDEQTRDHEYAMRSDQEIRTAVQDALLLDPRVNSFDVEPSVTAGVVTLRGVVDNLKAKRSASQDARNTVGVIRVENRMKVRPETSPMDTEIQTDVEDALARDAIVEGYEIDVRVSRGKVTLQGEVDSYLEKFQADDVASKVPGVVRVVNDIDVQYDDPITVYDPYVDLPYYPYLYADRHGPLTTLRPDAEIQESVEDEIWWSPFVDADQVEVTVDDGVVTLTGTVDSLAEVSAAIENAYEGGALAVDNELVIERQEAS